jgi:nitrogen-specific signal transduction histidine kinase
VLVEDALRFARATRPSTVETVQDLDADATAVLPDPTQVHQILLNLSTNAEHAMRPKGGLARPRISLGPRQSLPGAPTGRRTVPTPCTSSARIA